MDKEAQETLGNSIYEGLKTNGIVKNRGFITDIVSEALYEAGYHKLPDIKDELLTPIEAINAWNIGCSEASQKGEPKKLSAIKSVAKAQLAKSHKQHSKLAGGEIAKWGRLEQDKHKIPLFQLGNFTLHSGTISRWKIDCDALADWEAIAYMIQEVTLEGRKFGKVLGVPTGGLKLAKALEQYATEGATLIVDDVLTTGRSMEEMKATCEGEVIGVVVFARDKCPDWIRPLFSMEHRLARPDREKLIDSLHWKEFWFIGQGNAIFEGILTQESEEQIATLILALFPEITEKCSVCQKLTISNETYRCFFCKQAFCQDCAKEHFQHGLLEELKKGGYKFSALIDKPKDKPPKIVKYQATPACDLPYSAPRGSME